MKCLTTLEQICEELGENIDAPLCAEIQEHLKDCPKCCAYVDSIKKTVSFYRKLIDEDVPSEVDSRLWKILNLTKPESSGNSSISSK